MFGIGFSELLVIAVVLIIAVGPDKMPEFLKTTVKGFRQFRKTTTELRNAVAIDRILEDVDPTLRRTPPPALQLSEYEVQRENPRFGADVEFAYTQQAAFEGDWRDEYPPAGPDVMFEQSRHSPEDGAEHAHDHGEHGHGH